MHCILTSGWEDGIASLTERLVHDLAAGKKVAWLVSGGSNVPYSVQIMRNIPRALTTDLTITLVDERYGFVGHPDSNLEQLLKAGFDPKNAQLLPVLQSGLSLEKTAAAYDDLFRKLFAEADSRIAQVGIGEDGHIGGILPRSPAAKEKTKLAAGYKADDHQRLTITFPGFEQLTSVYAFAFGGNKRSALQQICEDPHVSLVDQPAQVLHKLRDAYLYNDQIGS